MSMCIYIYTVSVGKQAYRLLMSRPLHLACIVPFNSCMAPKWRSIHVAEFGWLGRGPVKSHGSKLGIAGKAPLSKSMRIRGCHATATAQGHRSCGVACMFWGIARHLSVWKSLMKGCTSPAAWVNQGWNRQLKMHPVAVALKWRPARDSKAKENEFSPRGIAASICLVDARKRKQQQIAALMLCSGHLPSALPIFCNGFSSNAWDRSKLGGCSPALACSCAW